MKRSIQTILGKGILLAVVVASSFLASSFSATGAAAQAMAPRPRCSQANTRVSLAPGQPTNTTLFASFCQPQAGATSTVIVTYHGNSYAQYYWDFPYQPQTYSFVDAMVGRGYTVLNLDRLAVDHAYTHPNRYQTPSADVMIASDAYALHQMVLKLRSGGFGRTHFSRVVLAAHSLGGYMAWQVGRDYPQDFDGFLLTGAVHPNSTINTDKVIPLLVPAAQNPKFKHAGLDAGYYAYKPDTRSIYYYLPNANPKVIAKDNQLMQTTVKAELIEGLTLQGTTVSRSIHVPVLVVLGQYDLFGCAPDAIPSCTNASVLKAEAPYYSAQACLHTDVVPNAGHDLNLQENAPVSYRDEATWIGAFVDHAQPTCGSRSESPGQS